MSRGMPAAKKKLGAPTKGPQAFDKVLFVRTNKDLLIWFNAIVSGAGFWALTYFLQDELLVYQNLLLYVSVISVSTFSKRPATLTMIVLASSSHFFFHLEAMTTLVEWAQTRAPGAGT